MGDEPSKLKTDAYTRLIKDAFMRIDSGLISDESDRWAIYLMTPNGGAPELKRFRLITKISEQNQGKPNYRSFALGPMPSGRTWELVIDKKTDAGAEQPHFMIPSSDTPDRPLSDTHFHAAHEGKFQELAECRLLTASEVESLTHFEKGPSPALSLKIEELGHGLSLSPNKNASGSSSNGSAPLESEQP